MTSKVYFSTAVVNAETNINLPHELIEHAKTKESVCAWALLIQKYKAVFDKDLSLVSFLDSGKPVVDGEFISISHSNGIVAVCFSKSTAVGVDIELVKDSVPKNLSKFLGEKNPPDFYKKWTEREAVIKAKNYSALKKGVESEFVGFTQSLIIKEKAFSLSVYGENAEFIKV